MMDKLKLLVNKATWFLRTGVSPVSEPKKLKKSLEELNHMTSKKFAMTMIAVAVVAFMYFVSVLFLFFFPADPHVAALVSMYKDMIFAIATIVGTLVGIEGFVDWKHSSEAIVSVNSSSIEQEESIDLDVHVISENYCSGPKEDEYTLSIDK